MFRPLFQYSFIETYISQGGVFRVLFTLVVFATLLLSCRITVGQEQPQVSISDMKTAGAENNIRFLLEQARSSYQIDPAKSLTFSRQAEELARKKHMNMLVSDALKFQGDALYELDSAKASAFAYLQGVEIEESLPDIRWDTLSHRLSDAGFMFSEMGLFDIALEYHRRALAINKSLNDSIEIAVNFVNIGTNLSMTGNYGDAIDTLNEALKIDRVIGTDSDIAIDYNNIGMVYKAWGKYDEAVRFFKMAYDIDERLGHESKLAIRLSNIAQVYMLQKDYTGAIRYFEQALQYDRKQNNTEKVPVRMQGLGLACLSLGQYEKSLAYFKEALDVYKSLGHESRIAVLEKHFGDLYIKLGQPEQAGEHYQNSLLLSQKTGMKPAIIDAAEGLYQLADQQGDYRTALDYYQLLVSVRDSVFSESNARQINEFQIRYETEKKESENKLLLKNIETRKRIHRFSLAIIAVLFMFTIVLFYAFRIKKKLLMQSRELIASERELNKLKIEQAEKHNLYLQDLLFAEEEIKKLQAEKLEQKNQELVTATLLIANNNEVFQRLYKTAVAVNPADDTTVLQTQLRDIVREIDNHTNFEIQWEQFRTHFESIHNSFFSRLHETCPELTQTDLQLCAYIRLNMATKEIARLMNITPESVNTHRYRLRKKLGLQGSENLDDFIHRL